MLPDLGVFASMRCESRVHKLRFYILRVGLAHEQALSLNKVERPEDTVSFSIITYYTVLICITLSVS